MAQRTVGVGCAPAASGTEATRTPLSPWNQAEEQQTVPAGSASRSGHRTERPVMLALVLEAVAENLHHHGPAPVDAAQHGASHGQPRVPPPAPSRSRLPSPPACRYLRFQVGIVGDL